MTVEQEVDTEPEKRNQTTVTETATPAETVAETTANATVEGEQGTDEETGPMVQDGFGIGVVVMMVSLSLIVLLSHRE